MRIDFLILYILFSVFQFNGQSQTNNDFNSDIQQNLPWADGEEIDLLIEQLQEYLDFPIEINALSFSELNQLPFITQRQALHLIEYIKRYGAVRSVHELSLIPGFSESFSIWVSSFIKFTGSETYQKVKANNYLRTGRLVQKRAGYNSGYKDGYKGNAYRILNRTNVMVRNNHHQFKMGGLIEKDPGEDYLNNKQPQHSSGFMDYQNENTHLIIGDYRMSFGRGLMFNQGFQQSVMFLSSGSGNTNYIRPNTSVDEFQFSRGFAVTHAIKKIKIGYHNSNRKISGEWTEGDFNVFSTGYYRTENELNKRSVAKENIQAGILSYEFERLNLGAAIMKQKVGVENNYKGASFYSAYYINNWLTDVEFSMNQNYQKAIQCKLNYVNEANDFIAIINWFEPNYSAPYSNAISGYGSVGNEKGILVSWNTQWLGWQINLFTQNSIFPQPQLNWQGNSFKNQNWVEFKKQVSDHKVYIRVRTSKGDRLVNVDEDYWSRLEFNKSQYRLHYSYDFNNWCYQTRSEFVLSNYFKEKGSGWLNYHELGRKGEVLDVRLRYSLFDIDNYNSRIYVYQPTVSYAFGMDFYSQTGNAIALLLSTKFKNWKLQFSAHHQTYFGLKEQGTGRSKIKGPHQTQLQLQLIFNY